MATLNPDGTFITRPTVGSRYRSLDNGKIHIVGASWAHGVVMESGPIVTATDLLTHYEPECPTCQAFHEPDYPHENTVAFRHHIYREHGREAIEEDTTAHCAGLLQAAMKRAMEA